MKTLEALLSALNEERLVVIARELTKIHEEVVSGTAQEVRDYFVSHEDKVRGEFVVMIGA